MILSSFQRSAEPVDFRSTLSDVFYRQLGEVFKSIFASREIELAVLSLSHALKMRAAKNGGLFTPKERPSSPSVIESYAVELLGFIK